MNHLAANLRYWAAIIMAAGTGYRLQSQLPKPLHLVANKSMIVRLVDVLDEIRIQPIIIVVGYQAELVRSEVLSQASNPKALKFIVQEKQLGTGDACNTGLRAIEESYSDITDIIVLNCDTPLLQAGTVSKLIELHKHKQADMTFLTAEVDDPSGLGRVLRNQSKVSIIEESVATATQKQIQEINAGLYCFKREILAKNLDILNPHNNQTHFYLTDLVSLLVDNGLIVETMEVSNSLEIIGVNTPDQLARCNQIAQSYFQM
ncbi:MAG: sugar phosphate nucleotidyltransferase [Candidatus Saccharibacteria bacterium]|nr:sugar phosphate nucleotidyltransferase [Candidatus Saccharibacteria bacterium]